jgi:hypothetical protein
MCRIARVFATRSFAQNNLQPLSNTSLGGRTFSGVVAFWRALDRHAGGKEEQLASLTSVFNFSEFCISSYSFYVLVSPLLPFVSIPPSVSFLFSFCPALFISLLYIFSCLFWHVWSGLGKCKTLVGCRDINSAARFSICDWSPYLWHFHHLRKLLKRVP